MYIYHIYLNARRGFFLKFSAYICEIVLIRMGSTELDCAKLDNPEPNQTMPSQTKAYITKLSHKICSQYTTQHIVCSNSLPTFWENLLVPYSRAKKSKREIRAQLKLTDTVFPGTWSFVQFFKLFPFSGKEACKLVDPSDWVNLNHWAL